jgi:hypothetical protein
VNNVTRLTLLADAHLLAKLVAKRRWMLICIRRNDFGTFQLCLLLTLARLLGV